MISRYLFRLTYLYGIGRVTAERILKEAQIEPQVRANKLTEDEVSRIAQIIDRNYVVEGQLRRQVSQNIARLREIGCYRGVRHRRACRFAVSIRKPTHARAKVPERQSPARRALKKLR